MVIDNIIIKKTSLKENENNDKKNKLDIILNNLNFKKEGENYNLSLKKEKNQYIFKIKSIAGLNEKDIFLLNELSKHNLITPYIQIKLGIPFAPSIVIGLILSIFLGDLFIFGIKLAKQLI